MEGKTHRELYPQQYEHRLVGKRVKVEGARGQVVISGTVERVMRSPRFGELAVLEGEKDRAWSASKCVVVE